MATHHGGTRCTSEDKDLNRYVEDIRGIDTGLDNDHESNISSDTTIAF